MSEKNVAKDKEVTAKVASVSKKDVTPAKVEKLIANLDKRRVVRMARIPVYKYRKPKLQNV